MDTFIINFDSTKVEIIWSLKSVTNSFCNGANDELTETFAAMFPDSQIAKSYFNKSKVNVYSNTWTCTLIGICSSVYPGQI